MAKLNPNRVGYGYQIPKPYDIVTETMGDPRTPTTERIDFKMNLGLWDMGEFGFGPGKPYPTAKDIEDEMEDPSEIKPHTRVAVTDK